MADLVIKNEEQKLEMQRIVLEYLIKNGGGSARNMRMEECMMPYQEDEKWHDIRTVLYSLKNLGLIEQVNFAKTNGKVYQVSEYGQQYFQLIQE